MMRHSLIVIGILLLFGSQRAVAQSSAALARGTVGAAGSQGRGGFAPVAIPGMQPSVAPQPGIPMALGNSGFPAALGSNVGLRAFPPVTAPPGVGNINHPGSSAGMQPLPTRVGAFPAGPAGYPNINSPGGTPGMNNPSMPPRWGDSWDGRWQGRGHDSFGQRRAAPNVVFYGVPYYVPYIVYTPDPTPTPGTASGPYGSGIVVSPPPPQPAQPSPAPAGKTITLLAFKDHSVVAVMDYWLEGDQVCYDTGSGLRTCIPLDRLDFPLTQQLNRERNVPFILEARP